MKVFALAVDVGELIFEEVDDLLEHIRNEIADAVPEEVTAADLEVIDADEYATIDLTVRVLEMSEDQIAELPKTES